MMLKVEMKYGDLFGQVGIEVIVYNSEPSKDGTHICASSVFNAFMIKRLSKKQINQLMVSMCGAIDACNEEVDRRIKVEQI